MFTLKSDVENYLKNPNSKCCLFRGHADDTYDLIPSIGRAPKSFINEKDKLAEFKKEIINIFYELPKAVLESDKEYFKEFGFDDCALLSLVQHYSYFPTRFLDWTDDIRISLYFACKDYPNKNGCVWAFQAPDNFSSLWFESEKDKGFIFDSLKIYFVPQFLDEIPFVLKGIKTGNNRPRKQQSIMTIHPQNSQGYFFELNKFVDGTKLEKNIIPYSSKTYFMNMLDKEYGINKDSVYDRNSFEDIKIKEAIELLKEKLRKRYCSGIDWNRRFIQLYANQ